ncbi:MAG: universal stress protein [Desulfobacterales bacterium]|jgi:nucleotide-binding universal stress UspA family protein
MSAEVQTFNTHILVAVDESENASRAVSYVGHMMASLKGVKVMILHVIRQAEEDYFATAAERDNWIRNYRQQVEDMLKRYRQMLIDAGFDPQQVTTRGATRQCPSLAECILEERRKTGFSTIVVGRQGLSRSEEFLFGSVSSKIVTHARNCTVWVVE